MQKKIKTKKPAVRRIAIKKPLQKNVAKRTAAGLTPKMRAKTKPPVLEITSHNLEGIVLLDSSKKIRFVNALAAKLLGISAKNSVGALFAHPVKVGEIYEIHTGKADAQQKWLELRTEPALCDKKNGYMVFLRDITTRKDAEEHLKKSMGDLKFALASEKVLLEELDQKNKELIHLSITDGLTKLYNHRFLQERYEYEFKRVQRYGGELSCMIMDIDHFKHVNDTYGHQVGDYVLREMARILKTSSREVDICGRYGGEEFLIITNLNVDAAMLFATRILNAVKNFVFEFKEFSFHVTISIGIAEHRPDINEKRDLIGRADAALYQAKNEGRNTIRIWKETDTAVEAILDNGGITQLTRQFADLSSQMQTVYMESTDALVRAVDAKDNYTREHSLNVTRYAVALGRQLKLVPADLDMIKNAALLHDIGKIGISQEILNKQSALTPAEFELLKKHPAIGVSILKDVTFLEREVPVILHHHERFDGHGYPQGLKGQEIPLGARILAVADAFVAMTCDNAYRGQKSKARALAELKTESKTHFDPDVLNVFIEMVEAEKFSLGENV